MPLTEFYRLVKSQHLSLHYDDSAPDETELWLTDSVYHEADNYILHRQGITPSRFARLQVSTAEYDQIRSQLMSDNKNNKSEGSGPFALKKAIKLRDLQRRSEGIIPDRLPSIDSSDYQTDGPRLAVELNAEFEPLALLAEPKVAGKVKMVMIKDSISAVGVLLDVAELVESIKRSVETRDAGPVVENAVKLVVTELSLQVVEAVIAEVTTAATAATIVNVAAVVAALVTLVFELLWKPDEPPVYWPVAEGPGAPRLDTDLSPTTGAPSLGVSFLPGGTPVLKPDTSAMNGVPDLNVNLEHVKGSPLFEAVGQSIEVSVEYVKDNASLRVLETVALLQNVVTGEVIVVSTNDYASSFEMIQIFETDDNDEQLVLGISTRFDVTP